MKKPLILIGGGGHAKSCIDVIEVEDSFYIEGILDLKERVGEKVLGYDIIGTEDLLEELRDRNYSFFISVGQIESAMIRRQIWNRLRAIGAQIATVISPGASVSKHAKISAGTIVMHGARINAGAELGFNNIINTNAVIEHDTIVGNHCHISTQSIINGSCRISDEVFIGSGAVVLQGVEITSNVTVGASTLVNKPIRHPGIYIGIPFARI
ncbi:acetyltransferase [Chitinophaga polysaccharea]|uniref:acetyltransferase n=1 Tax=Chitinophaga polysaccharea TaxID=1293035 RepID=UPI0014554DF1|nr:acetyltransferase [Chitinophaga polysaccharea]NLR61850.1 acetyltransferase [Chitinophaga polysaccharea]